MPKNIDIIIIVLMKIFDLIIVGSGPSGSILSYLLRNSGLSICVVDRRYFTKNNPAFTKACGGLIAPDAQRALASLNIALPVDILTSPQIFSVKTIDLESGLNKRYQRFYINVNREKFDAFLASLPSGSTKLYGKVLNKITYEDDLYKLFFTDGTVLYSRLLVGADGAASVCAKQLNMLPNVRKYVCVQQIFNCNDNNNFYSAIFDKSLTDYSGWTFVKDNKTYVGAAFDPKKDPHKKLDAMIQKLKDNGYCFGAPISREGAILNRPLSLLRSPVSNGYTAALIGEAAGFVSPSSAEGFSYAIYSAIYAAQSILKYKSFKGYKTKSLSIRIKLFLKKLKIPFMYNKFLRNIVLKSGIKSIKPHDSI